MDAFIHYGMAAGIQAIENSGLEITEENAERIGVAIGAGIGTSASPYSIKREASPILCVPVVQAVTMAKFGPLRPYLTRHNLLY
jgi:hypothetical protein